MSADALWRVLGGKVASSWQGDPLYIRYMDSQLPRIPAGRIGDPAELAATVVFLLSPASAYVTGTTLIVDGGPTAS